MTTFYLIRHATCDPVGRMIAGWMPGVHLNEEGRAQAEKLAARLAGAPIRAIYSSPLERALETAEAIAGLLNLEINISVELGEIRYGAWTGRTFEELSCDPLWKSYNSFPSNTRIPEGEMVLETQARAVAEIARLCAKHPEQSIAAVSHGDVIKSVIAHYAGLHIDLFPRIEISPASVSIIDINDWGPVITLLNDTGRF